MKKSTYCNQPIGSLNSLSKLLAIDLLELTQLAEEADSHYFPNDPEVKSDGRIRQTYRVSKTLAPILKRMNKKIFVNVSFPEYLQGSIKDLDNPRSYIVNAIQHTGKAFIIHEDIRDFFPSIRADLVKGIWQYFFNFPENVAYILTQLTTYNGFVPQGAHTSSNLANLVFWDQEPQVELFCRDNGYVYTRYVDDMVVSSNRILSRNEQHIVTSKIYSMLFSKQIKPNRKKRRVFTQGQRMIVTQLNVNSFKPTINKDRRNKIRTAVYQCEQVPITERGTLEYRKLYQCTWGRVLNYKQHHPRKSKVYLERLKVICPLVQDSD